MRGSHTGPDGNPDTGEAPESSQPTSSLGLHTPRDIEEAPPGDEESNDDFLFYLYRGSELLQDDRAHEAKEELERALRLQPHDTKGQDLLAVVYFKLGHFERAIAIYEQLRRKNPRDTALLLNLSLCYLKTGQPSLARRHLEALLAVIPSHARAWGYLGLACERIGDLGQAQRAFERGGHEQMARRVADKRASIPAAELPHDERTALAGPVADVVAAAFEELDAGELSFELAHPGDEHEGAADGESSGPVELGQRPDTSQGSPKNVETVKADTAKSDTLERPPGAPPAAAPSSPGSVHFEGAVAAAAYVGRRPTLIAPAPPAPNFAEVERLAALDSPGSEDSLAPPSVRRPVVAVPPVRVPAAPPLGVDQPTVARFKTLSPKFMKLESEPPVSLRDLTQSPMLPSPDQQAVVMHPSGVALVMTRGMSGFAARVESIRVSAHTHAMEILERQGKGRSTGEPFGGAASPIARVQGEGQLMLAARRGRKLTSFALEDETCFVREDVLLGFELTLAYEHGRLSTGEGELITLVQLRGKGSVLLETLGEPLTVEVTSARGVTVRREVVLAWFGRIVARALPAGDAPCGQRGLVSFAGAGNVLVAGA